MTKVKFSTSFWTNFVDVVVVLEKDHCLDNACANGATCVSEEHGYSCACTDDWTGDLCDKGKNFCSSF